MTSTFVYFSKFLQVILTGATNIEILICNADLECKNETDLNNVKPIPVHNSTPQVDCVLLVKKIKSFNH